jgi:hypothetical protein
MFFFVAAGERIKDEGWQDILRQHMDIKTNQANQSKKTDSEQWADC